MSYLIYAFFSALAAAGVAIFAKLGLKDVDSTLATTIRAIIMALFLFFVSLILKKFQGFSSASISQKDWILIVLAGISGAVSWIFYFMALKSGQATTVSAIDRTSIVFVVLLAALFLGEALNLKSILGAIMIVGGAILISLK